MREVYIEALATLEKGTPFALATVVKTWGSAPRKAGAHMFITADKMIGSVSGGCVENDVFHHAQEVIQRQQAELIHYGVSDEDAWQVGLSCGGKIDVFIEGFAPGIDADLRYWKAVAAAIEENTGAIIVHELTEQRGLRKAITPGSFGNAPLETLASETFRNRGHRIVDFHDQKYLLEVVAPKSQLLIIGASHLAAELVAISSQFNFESIVIDPRGFFSMGTAFAVQPDAIHTAWPEEVLDQITLTPYTYAVVLSHDPKIDDQALHVLLPSDVGYIGALGSSKTHLSRTQRLKISGFSDEQIARIHAPIGVDIHAQSAQEIALSILAEMISIKNAHAL